MAAWLVSPQRKKEKQLDHRITRYRPSTGSDFAHPIPRWPDQPIPLAYNRGMANLTLVYGLRLLPSDEVAEVGAATIKLKSGREAHVTMHTLEGSKDEIERQLRTSLAAFFDIYPEI
jgi:hypothetical protein